MNTKNIILLALVIVIMGSCKPSLEKRIGKAERRIERKKEQITKKEAQISGLEQKIEILREEQERLIALGGGDKDREKKMAEIEKKREQLSSLELEIKKLEDQVDVNGGNGFVKNITFRKVKRKDFKQYLDIQGKVTTKENVIVSAETGGSIKSIPVREGQFVNRGQILAILDDALILNNISEVENALDLANTVFERQKRLWDQSIGSELQYLEAKNNKENLEKKMETLNTQLDKTRVRAPFSGNVDQVFASEGELAGPGSPVLRLVRLGNVQVEAEVSEAYVGKFKAGDPVIIEFPSIQETVEAKISSVGDFINPGNRTFRIEVNLPNTNGMLKPNLLANVKLKEFESDDQLVIPSRLIQQEPQGDFVFTIEASDSTVVKKRIEAGRSYDGETVVTEGLEEGELIVDKGYKDVVNGDKVNLSGEQE